MSAKIVMAWVVLAGALAAVYLAVAKPAAGTPLGERESAVSLGIDPAAVTSLEFGVGETVRVERDAESGTGWSIEWDEGGQTRVWGARDQAVRGFLRALVSEGVASRTADDGESVDERASVAITLSDGSRVAMSIGEESVGGRVAGALKTGEGVRPIWIGRDTSGLVRRDSVLAWRDLRLMAGSARATRVSVEGGGASVELSRARGAWVVTAPVEARGDESRAEDTLGRLRALGAESFIGGGAGGVTGLDRPVARMVIEAERREPVGETYERVVVRQMIEIGGEADAGAATRFVRASAEVVREGVVEREYGPVVCVMSVEGLGGVTAQAEAYISRIPVGVPAGDVGGVALVGSDGTERARFMRDRRGWRRVGENGDVGASEVDAAGVESLLAMLCDDGMERVEALGGDSAIEGAFGEVRLEAPGGGVIGTLEFGGSDGAPVVRDRGVFWIGGGERGAAVLAWVRGELGA